VLGSKGPGHAKEETASQGTIAPGGGGVATSPASAFAPDFCEIVRQTARTVNREREPHSTAVLKSVLIMQVAKPIPCYCPNTPRLALLDPLNHGRQACALRRIVHLQNAGLEIAKHAFQLPPRLAFDNHIVRQFFSLVGIAEVESGGK
jgi:hypothetical protein